MSGWRTGMDRQKQKINILIRGAGFKNKGAEAMLLTTCHEIAQRLKTANFSALVSRNEIQTCKSHGICPVVTRGSNLFGKPLFLAQCLLRHPKIFSVAISSQNTAKQVLQVNNSDVILDISGYAYGDSWGIGSAQRTLTIAAYCKAKGKPYLFLPQAWGPFSDQKLAEKVTQICKNSGLVYARDKRSLSCLMGISDSSALHKEVVPDIAFKFKGEKSQVGSEALEKHGIDCTLDSECGNADPDLDGLTNAEEFEYGTDPNLADSDGGCESDGSEIATGHDPLDPTDDGIACLLDFQATFYSYLLELTNILTLFDAFQILEYLKWELLSDFLSVFLD